MKRVLILVLSMMLLASPALAALEDVPWSSEYPFFDEPHQLDVVTIRLTHQDIPSKDRWFYKWVKEAMNIEINIIDIEENDRNEKLNLLFASDSLPDVFYNCKLTESEIVQYGYKEKQLIPLNELIEEYAPNIQAFMGYEPGIAAAWYYIDGNIYTLPGFTGYNHNQNYTTLRAWINSSWLENLGLENPDNLDDFYDVLKAFKEEDANGNGDPDDEIPIDETQENVTWLMMVLMGAMTRDNSTLEPAILNGKPIIPANNYEFYKSLLTTLHQYYEEGLLNPDMFTLTLTQMQSDTTEDRVGVHAQSAPHVMPTTSYDDWTSIKPMTSEFCSEFHWPESSAITHGQFSISRTCKDVEAAIKFADWHFTLEGALYSWDGPIEGSEDLMGMADGWYYDAEKKAQAYHYGEGVTTDIEYRQNLTPGTHEHVGISAANEAADYVLGFIVENKSKGASAYWRAQMDQNCVPYYTPVYPDIYFEEDVNARIIELQTPLMNYIATMEAKFISGKESLDNFDEYYQALQEMGLDEYEGYFIEAYERYLDNM